MKNFILDGVRKLLPGHDPNFLIIGTQKSGSTSLHNYLNQHPKLVGSRPKEVHFFERYINYPNIDLEWYRQSFKTINSTDKLFFEATPNYIYYEEALRKIKEVYPTIKMLLILRNPVSRAYSAWNMYLDYYKKGIAQERLRHANRPNTEHEIITYLFKGRDTFPSFRETLDIELKLIQEGIHREPAVIRRGLYYEQIQGFLKHFSRSQLLVIGMKELALNPVPCCNKVLDFLGVDEKFTSVKSKAKNKRSYDVKMSDADKQYLEDFYKKPNSDLFNFLGEELLW